MAPLSKFKIILIAALITTAILVPILILIEKPETNLPPSIHILSPTPTTYITNQITIIITTDDTDIDTIWYRIYSQTAGNWIDANNLTWTSSTPRTLSVDGCYMLYVWANDTAGNLAEVQTCNFTIDALPPELSVLSPTNSTYTSQTTEIIIDINNSDLNIDTIWYRIYNNTDAAWVDSGNLTWTTPTNRTLGKGGVYTLYVWANDTYDRVISASPITFTMIHEIYYTGDHAFTSSFVVEPYQKVIFQDGQFSSTTGAVTVLGALEMHDVVWTSNLFLYGNSVINATNTSCNTLFRTYGNVVATLDTMTFSNNVEIHDSSTITLTNSSASAYFSVRDNARVDISDCTLYRLDGYNWAEINASYTNSNNLISFYDNSKVIFRNYIHSYYIYMYDNCEFIAINSTIQDVYSYLNIYTGNWTINQSILSGTGTSDWNTITLINTACGTLYQTLDIWASSEVVINNTDLYTISCHDTANVNISNSNILNMFYLDNSRGSLDDVSVIILRFATNQTVFMRDTSVNFYLEKLYRFYQGNIVGFNETYTGALSWANTTIVYGPGNSIANLYYSYEIYKQVDLTVTNTQIQTIGTFENSNASIYNSTLMAGMCDSDSNLTLYYSTVANTISASLTSNVTLYNSTVFWIYLYDSTFLSVTNFSYVNTLYTYGTSSYYQSPDSKIENIY